ncbi:helix-turn-helix domain-containing protein [Promicromonospora soli]
MAISPQVLGERIELAREAAAKTQAELAAAVGVDRTAISKITSGTRKISALELAALAKFLGRPLPWFLSDSPAPVVARWQAVVRDRPSTLAAELAAEDLAADVEQLRALGVLPAAPHAELVGTFNKIEDVEDASAAARTARKAAGFGGDALGPMADVLDDFGLYVATVVAGEAVDGVMLPQEGFAVTVINADQSPGRRRFTAAHELGHYLFDDTYAAEAISGGTSEHERLVNAFAAEFLLPLDAVRSHWTGNLEGASADLQRIREEAIWLSSTYRMSWSGVLARLGESDLIDDQQSRALQPNPTLAELRSYGRQPEEDLCDGDLSAAVSRAALDAYRDGLIGSSRASEILRGAGGELPPPRDPGRNDFRADFYA